MDNMKNKILKIFIPSECSEIISDFEKNKDFIKLSTEHGVSRISSYEIDFKYFSKDVKELINNKINNIILPITGGKIGMVFGVKYTIDTKSYMLPHYDCNSYSCVIELNNEFENGGTHFILQNKIIRAENVGEGVLFQADKINSYHAASPITKGIRYVLVIRIEKKNIFNLILRSYFLSFVDFYLRKFKPKLFEKYTMDPSCL